MNIDLALAAAEGPDDNSARRSLHQTRQSLILAPKKKARQIAAPHVPRWGAQLTSNWSESRAWETYRMLQRRYASLIGDREPILRSAWAPSGAWGSVSRTIIRISDDNRSAARRICAAS